MQGLSVKEVEYIAFRLAQECLSFNEPIPDFSTRYPNVLESCLAAPFQGFSGKSFYAGLMQKAGILFYLMIKNHPFQNGNKRIAFTMWIAQSPPQLKPETIKAIEKFFKQHTISLKK
jgi:prophage maintenance system killer protein